MNKSGEINSRILESYLSALRNLSADLKLELIAKLSLSMKKPAPPAKPIEDFFGKWQSDETAEELIEAIRSSRVFNRKIEEF